MNFINFISLLFISFEFGAITANTHKFNENNKVPPPTNDWIDKVYVVFMNHLDVGYANFINNILNEYFDTYFSLAADIAEQLRVNGFVERFIYTSHPWIISLYLNCPPNLVLSGIKLKCPTQLQLDKFMKAVKLGDITWHAGPMNMQPEFMEPWLMEAATDIAAQLDKDFNISRPMRVLSQRDVPSMTQGIIPTLLRKGIGGVSVGVNMETPPPALPKLFRWRYGGGEVLANWHANGYPNDVGPTPASPGGLTRDDCAFVAGFSKALCFVFRTDNAGPPKSIQEVLSNYEILRANFPNAELVASRIDDFFGELDAFKENLPIVTNEFGDTWIQGIASDPVKNQRYMVVSRILGKCIEAKNCSLSDVRIWNATRFLLKSPEHTWGLNSEHDNLNWANKQFFPLHKKNGNFINSANSWSEQRAFTTVAIEALRDHHIKNVILDELKLLKPSELDFKGWIKIPDPQQHLKCPQQNIQDLQFSSEGSIISLVYKQIQWADKNHELWKFIYNSYNETDFNDFAKVYNYNGVPAGYYKPNLTANAHPQSKKKKVPTATLR